MTINGSVRCGNPDAGNPHVRFRAGEVASAIPRLHAWCAMMVVLCLVRGMAATYYVASDGSDTDGTGSYDAPYATFAKALTRATTQGDEVVGKAGMYTSQPRIASGAPIMIRGATGKAEDVVIDFEGKTSEDAMFKLIHGTASSLTISNVTGVASVLDFESGGIAPSVSNIIVRHASGVGILVCGQAGSRVEDSVVSSCGGSKGIYKRSSTTIVASCGIRATVGATIRGCTVADCLVNNSDPQGGAGISGTQDATIPLEIVDTVVTNCRARYCGGILYPDILRNVTVIDCHSGLSNGVTRLGTAICTKNASRTTVLSNVTVKGCSDLHASTHSPGVGVYNDGGAVEIVGCHFLTNGCKVSSGVLYGSAFTVRDTVFSGNSTRGYACVATISGRDSSYTGCTFDGNTAESSAAAFRIEVGACLALTNCVFRNHKNIPAVYVTDNATCLARGCTFRNNSTSGYGGAVLVDRGADSGSSGGAFHAADTLFEGNTSARCGGAVSASNGEGSTGNFNLSFDRCTFRNNSASKYGGAVCARQTESAKNLDCLFRSCLFEGNHCKEARGGGAVYFVSNDGRMENCTFVKNYTEGNSAGAIYYRWGAAGHVVNCAFVSNYVNTTTLDTTDQGIDNDTWVAYSLSCPQISRFKAAQHCITGDPKFTDFARGDYTFGKNSPLTDAGLTDETWMSGVPDIRGDRRFPRVFGKAVDIGAYEYKLKSGLLVVFR